MSSDHLPGNNDISLEKSQRFTTKHHWHADKPGKSAPRGDIDRNHPFARLYFSVTSFESWSHFTCPYHTRQWNKGDSDYVPNFGVQIVLTCLAQNWVPKPFKPRHIRSRNVLRVCGRIFSARNPHHDSANLSSQKPPFLLTSIMALSTNVAPNLVAYHWFYIKVAI